MNVALLDRFVSKGTGEQKRKLFSPTPSARALSKLEESGREAKERYPEDGPIVDSFFRSLKEQCKNRYKKAIDEKQPMKAEARFFLSEDRMSAYGCLLPPENGGAEITLEEFLEDMHYEGINFGIVQEQIGKELEAGYLRMFPVARASCPRRERTERLRSCSSGGKACTWRYRTGSRWISGRMFRCSRSERGPSSVWSGFRGREWTAWT